MGQKPSERVKAGAFRPYFQATKSIGREESEHFPSDAIIKPLQY
jgi:hypothetical protein